MDRMTARSAAFQAPEAALSGWDSHAVWRDRVHAARQPVRHTTPAIASLRDTSAGWDPLETWRLRVQRPRLATR